MLAAALVSSRRNRCVGGRWKCLVIEGAAVGGQDRSKEQLDLMRNPSLESRFIFGRVFARRWYTTKLSLDAKIAANSSVLTTAAASGCSKAPWESDTFGKNYGSDRKDSGQAQYGLRKWARKEEEATIDGFDSFFISLSVSMSPYPLQTLHHNFRGDTRSKFAEWT